MSKDRREYYKEYYSRPEVVERRKNYYKEYNIKYREANKEKIKEYMKNYRKEYSQRKDVKQKNHKNIKN